jgi:hypothetical protein
MSFNLYGSIKDQARIQKSFLKTQHNTYDSHTHYDPFKAPDASLDPTNLKQKKRFNFNQGIQEEQLPYGTSYKKEPTIAYFQAKIPPYIANRENRGSTLNYNTMINNLGWN